MAAFRLQRNHILYALDQIFALAWYKIKYRICRCISRPFSIKNRPKKIDLDLYTES